MTTITHNVDGSITVSVTLALEGNMMEMENTILDAVNSVGCIATGEALKCFDTKGTPIIREGVKLTSKNRDSKKYHRGDWQFCLDNARFIGDYLGEIVRSSTWLSVSSVKRK